jgi:hypothetical protein
MSVQHGTDDDRSATDPSPEHYHSEIQWRESNYVSTAKVTRGENLPCIKAECWCTGFRTVRGVSAETVDARGSEGPQLFSFFGLGTLREYGLPSPFLG